MKISRRQLLEAVNSMVVAGGAAAIAGQADAEPIQDIKELDIKPGDTLVLETHTHLSRDQVAAIAKAFDAFLPGVRILVLDVGLRAAAVIKGSHT